MSSVAYPLTLKIDHWNTLLQEHALVAQGHGDLHANLLPNGQLLPEADRTANVYQKLNERRQEKEREYICCLQECGYSINPLNKKMLNMLLSEPVWAGGAYTYQKNSTEGAGILVKGENKKINSFETIFDTALDIISFEEHVLSHAKTATVAVLNHKRHDQDEEGLQLVVVSAHFSGFGLLQPYGPLDPKNPQGPKKDFREDGNNELRVLDQFLKQNYPNHIHIICADFNDVVPHKCTPQDQIDQQQGLTTNRLALAQSLGFTYNDNDFSSEPHPPKKTLLVTNAHGQQETLESQKIWPQGRTIDFLLYRLPPALAKQYQVALTTQCIYDDVVKKTSDHALLRSTVKFTPVALPRPVANNNNNNNNTAAISSGVFSANNNNNNNNTAAISANTGPANTNNNNSKTISLASANNNNNNNSSAAEPESPRNSRQQAPSKPSLLSSLWSGICWAGRNLRWILTCGWYPRKA